MGITELQGKYIQRIENLQWFLVRTMPKGEQQAETFFKLNGIPCYLPRFNRTYINTFAGKNGKKYSYKRPPVLTPMFPGYIFAAMDLDMIGDARRQRCIAQICFHSNYTEDHLISDLQKVQDFEFLAKNNQVEIKQEIVAGTPVVINKGVLKGWEGIVEKRIDRNFLFIRITSVGFCLGISCAAVDCDVVSSPHLPL